MMSKNNEHGTTVSYIIGFVLSLIFTVIPYHLVVNEVMQGKALIAVILVVAVLQMAIQLLFFLHLGRGPKPFYNVVFFFATFGVIVITIGASLFIMDNLYRNMSPNELIQRLAQREGIYQVGGNETGACAENRKNHVVSVIQGVVTPTNLQAGLCDTLTFVDYGGAAREFNFGVYPESESYGGEYEVKIGGGRPETITLNQSGVFSFYDALDPSIAGSFSVAPEETPL